MSRSRVALLARQRLAYACVVKNGPRHCPAATDSNGTEQDLHTGDSYSGPSQLVERTFTFPSAGLLRGHRRSRAGGEGVVVVAQRHCQRWLRRDSLAGNKQHRAQREDRPHEHAPCSRSSDRRDHVYIITRRLAQRPARRHSPVRGCGSNWQRYDPPMRVQKPVLAVGVALVAVLVAACSIIGGDHNLGRTMRVENATGDAITVLWVRDGVESRLAPLEPGEVYTIAASLYEDGCLPDPLVARGADGAVVARRDERLCDGDTWTVD